MAHYGVSDSTLPVEGPAESLTRPPAWRLCWVFPTDASTTIELPSDCSSTIGRAEGTQVRLESHRVSRRHAEIGWDGGVPSLRDLKSRNGTFVNGSPVTRTLLQPGDVLRVGDRLGIVMRTPEASVSDVNEIATGLWAGPTLRRALEPVRAMAKTDLPVSFHGATGSGKERAARALHEWSGRSGPFVAVNCAAIPEQLAEAELFGYRQGAFTGADKAAIGHLRSADQGTLLLDEITDLPLSQQPKLLRAIELGEVQALGQVRPAPINVRFVAASQLPLAGEVAKGRFRADLAARLAGLTIRLPALVERREEIPALFMQLLASRLGSSLPVIDAPLVERLMLHDWPGNVRELDLLVRRLLGLHGNEPQLSLAHLTGTELAHSPASTDAPMPVEANSTLSREERELKALLSALKDCGGNLTRAASRVRISRQRAYRLLQEQSKVSLEALRKRRLQ